MHLPRWWSYDPGFLTKAGKVDYLLDTDRAGQKNCVIRVFPKNEAMPHIKLKARPSYEYAHPLKVRVTDINYGGHLGNEALLGLIHEARAAFLQKLGFNTVKKGEDLLGLIIADINVNFKEEAFAGDQLMIDCQIGEVTPKSFRLFHRIRREKDVVALVETGLIAYDYQDRKIASLPKGFPQGLGHFRNKENI